MVTVNDMNSEILEAENGYANVPVWWITNHKSEEKGEDLILLKTGKLIYKCSYRCWWFSDYRK
jgi:hypothetical protein